jgi:UDP-glucose 4-epimerase
VKVLVTGHRGRLGAVICEALASAGHEWTGFDRDEGDIRDVDALTAAARGIQAIVHLAGVADDLSEDAMEKMDVNLIGTWSVLVAAEAAQVERVIYFSSGKALGMTERIPDYLPIDDEHPARPTEAYGLSKLLSEDMCEAVTRRTGIATVCLRPVAVFDVADYARWEAFLASDRPTVDVPWHMGVFVDVRDVAQATVLALSKPETGHARLLLCGEDSALDGDSRELARKRLPSVPWKGSVPEDPHAPLVSSKSARALLGWRPVHRWDSRARASTDRSDLSVRG